MKTKKGKNATQPAAQKLNFSETQNTEQSTQSLTSSSTIVDQEPSGKRLKSGSQKKNAKSAPSGDKAKSTVSDMHSTRKRSTAVSRQICNMVYKTFPELDEMWAADPTADNPKIKSTLDDISVVIQYFATHPRVLVSIRTGMLK